MKYTDDELLKIVAQERRRSIGFGEGDGGELAAARSQALAYYKGEMTELASLPNRSKAVDTTVADAVETVLPDIIEVFVGGEDIATFVPLGEQDEDSAQKETEFVQHVVMTENEGFLLLYTAMKDALINRTGVIHWWWEEDERRETLAAGMSEDVANYKRAKHPGSEVETSEDGSFSVAIDKLHGKVKVKAFPCEDFTVAPDTVSIRDATYCAVRDRPRVQELISRGLEAEKVRNLPAYADRTDAVSVERDEAGETSRNASDGTGDLRTVEVRAHYIRLADEEDETKLTVWCIVTDSQETMLLHKEEVGHIPFAVLTPYIVPHRLYGESVADKLIQVQQIQTAILRMMLDSGYFALNQRLYVDENKVTEHTITDLLANEPGRPIRGRGEGAIVPVGAGALNFDVFAAMEYVNTLAEKRSGIVRNAQGLNPDTLHDTAKGAMALIQAAQKRVRMIARIFAETGIKDLFLGVHCMLRSAWTEQHEPMRAKIGGGWRESQPDQWPERCAMTVHVGIGSAGREMELAVAGQRLEMMQTMAAQQGGLSGPLLDAQNVYAALKDWERAAGSKKAATYWSDPAQAQPQPPQPDLETVKAQGQLQLQREKAASEVQLAREKAQVDAEAAAAKHQMDAQAAEAKAQRDHEIALTRIEGELALKRYQIDQELELKRQEQVANIALEHEQIALQADASALRETEVGGEPG